MADDLLTDVKLSSDWEFENTEVIGSISKADLDFINNDVIIHWFLSSS